MNAADRIAARALKDKIAAFAKSLREHEAFKLIPDAAENVGAEIEQFKEDVDDIKTAEEEKLDNMTDALKEGTTGQAISEAITYLENAADTVGEAMDAITELTEKLDEAIEKLNDACTEIESACEQ